MAELAERMLDKAGQALSEEDDDVWASMPWQSRQNWREEARAALIAGLEESKKHLNHVSGAVVQHIITELQSQGDDK